MPAERLADVLAEILAEILAERLADVLADVLAEILADMLLDTDSEIEVLSLTEVDKLLEFSELLTDVVPKTTVSFVTNKSGLSNVFPRLLLHLRKL